MIKVGDLVIVTRGGCSDTYIGYVFRVARVAPSAGVCRLCHTHHVYGPNAPMAFEENSGSGFELPRLKRIDPLPESEDTKEREEMKV